VSDVFAVGGIAGSVCRQSGEPAANI